MLSIQPRITTYSAVKPIAFKGEETPEFDESLYQGKVDYYKDQKSQLERLAEDENTPKPFRKILKGVAILSGAFLEGWAVYWGASKASVFIKKAAKGINNSKFAHGINEKVLKPAHEFVKSNIGKFNKFVMKNVEKLDNSEFAQKKFGKVVTAVVDFIVKAAKWARNGMRKLGEIIKKPFAKNSADEIYDKAADVTSKIMGVGSGVAGGYAAAHNMFSDEKSKVEVA